MLCTNLNQLALLLETIVPIFLYRMKLTSIVHMPESATHIQILNMSIKEEYYFNNFQVATLNILESNSGKYGKFNFKNEF
jgi:hypothetical protein